MGSEQRLRWAPSSSSSSKANKPKFLSIPKSVASIHRKTTSESSLAEQPSKRREKQSEARSFVRSPAGQIVSLSLPKCPVGSIIRRVRVRTENPHEQQHS